MGVHQIAKGGAFSSYQCILDATAVALSKKHIIASVGKGNYYLEYWDRDRPDAVTLSLSLPSPSNEIHSYKDCTFYSLKTSVAIHKFPLSTTETLSVGHPVSAIALDHDILMCGTKGNCNSLFLHAFPSFLFGLHVKG